ncbi:MAG: isoaspartyl peptidase/L-asparaginase [Fervidicoccus fontis]
MVCKPIIMVHGGAGSWSKKPKETKISAQQALKDAVTFGMEILKREKSAVEAVAEAIRILEDSGSLNAGLGSVTNSEGYMELDAGIMDGKKMDAGAVAAIRGIRNPILVAMKVMRETPHVILVGEGAQKFALSKGFKIDERINVKKDVKDISINIEKRSNWIHDTVGAIAISSDCDTAAGASTGGIRGKMPGRIGDTPIPGAGYYANHFAAAAATGIGEVIILTGATRWIVERGTLAGNVLFVGKDLIEYVNRMYSTNTIGIIMADIRGNYGRIFNTEALPYGVFTEDMQSPEVGGIPL